MNVCDMAGNLFTMNAGELVDLSVWQKEFYGSNM